MAELTPQDMAAKLLADNFSRSGPTTQTLSDPIADTPMVITLDELRPYELNPRLTRNPLYEEIKASIRERGLDAAPPITRRPDAKHYIIRNGGNTRLAILRELWAETKEERFFRITCLFRPWPDRGEIVALTGHLAENELHGGLTFVERALGVEKARELYEQESGSPLSQSDLARRLAADGYPVPQPHISRMQDTVRYLLPAIPQVLYGGLGRHQAERLAVLRKSAQLAWEQHALAKKVGEDYDALFHDVLASFDTQTENFNTKRVQDELVGRMAELLSVDYNLLELDIDNIERRQRAVTQPPRPPAATPDPAPATAPSIVTDASLVLPSARIPAPTPTSRQTTPQVGAESGTVATRPPSRAASQHDTSNPDAPVQMHRPGDTSENDQSRIQAHIVSTAASTERLSAIQHLVAEHTGEDRPDFTDNALRAIPVQVGGLYPITDVWYIEPSLDTPDRLRVHLAQFSREIAKETGALDWVDATDTGIGFSCEPQTGSQAPSDTALAGLMLLSALSKTPSSPLDTASPSARHLEDVLGPLLHGLPAPHGAQPSIVRLSDGALVQLFRMVRLARRLHDLEAGLVDPSDE